jgi:hypothetical protein
MGVLSLILVVVAAEPDEGLAKNFEVPRGTRGLNWPLVEQLLSALNQGQWQPDLQRLEKLSQGVSVPGALRTMLIA